MTALRLITAVPALRQLLSYYHKQAGEIGFVPTMGALHQGHLSLIERAKRENGCVVVSIFVNPLQFGANEDFARYPRPLAQDVELCQRAGVDIVFAPQPEVMGLEPKIQVVPDSSLADVLCGQTRPGHFTGVATIVAKLLNLVQPHRLYLGEKDGQQLAIVQQLVHDLCFPVQVVACPTVREQKGIALSSRNQYLNSEQKQTASHIYQALQLAENAFKQGIWARAMLLQLVTAELRAYPDLQVEYLDLVDSATLAPVAEIEEGTTAMLAIAVQLGSTRLIDNLRLSARQPIIAIDGPAGAGKSTVTSLVAKELGLLHLDTGAMYRCIALAVLESAIDPQDEVAVAELASNCHLQMIPTHPPQVLLNGRDVSTAIRTTEVTKIVSIISAQSTVRQLLWQYQRSWGKKGGIVMEGRDIGTRVFPSAELKIFLTASVKERALRRQQELMARGEAVDLTTLEQAIQERDYRDSNRPISPLRQAEDAILINTDGLTIAAVVAQIVQLYQAVIATRTQA